MIASCHKKEQSESSTRRRIVWVSPAAVIIVDEKGMMHEAEKLDGLILAYQNTQDVMLLCPKKCID